MKRPSRFTLVFITVMFLYVFGYILHVTVNPKYPYEADLPNYAVALVQSENPELFSRDPVFKDGVFTKMIWSSSFAYMNLFEGLYNLTNRNISATLALLQLIPAFTLFLSFYWLMCAFPLDRWLRVIFSVGVSYWLILTRLEGIPTVYYYACVPIFLRLLWQHLAEPSLNDRPVVLWRVVIIGMAIGISPMLINSVNGLAFNLLTLVLVTVQFLARRMRWTSYAALLIGLIPLLLFAALGGAGGASAIQDRATAEFLFNDQPTGTLGITIHFGFIAHGIVQIFDVHNSWIFYFPVLTAVIALNVLLRYWPKPTRALKIIYLTMNGIMWLGVLGNIGIILFIYFLSRFWRDKQTTLDYVLITGLSAGVFIGPILLWILALAWRVIHWFPLVFIMWQMFRFHMLTYFLAALAVAFMIDQITARIGNRFIRRLMQIVFIVTLGMQPISVPVITMSFLLTLGLVLTFIRLSLSSKLFLTRPLIRIKSGRTIAKLAVVTVGASIFIMGVAFWGTWASGWDSSVPLNLESLIATNSALQSSEQTIRKDYLDMTEWLRVNTPQDSLVHLDYGLADRSGYFRFLSERSMFFTWMDQSVGQYSANLAESNRKLLADYSRIPGFRFGALVALYDINYVIVHNGLTPFLPTLDKGEWVVPVLAYNNTTYDIYQVKRISTGELISMLLSRGDV
jgi:hypothetical protein